MSLFKKNVPLQEEEVAPVMQEYSGQHPVLNFTPVSAIVKSDHLDQYMEVHPFASSEPRYNPTDQVKKEKDYAKMLVDLGLVDLGFELREKTEEDKLPWQRFSDLKTSGGHSFLLKVKMIFDPRTYRTGKIKEKPPTNIYLPLSLTKKTKLEVEEAAIKLTTFRTKNNGSKLLLGNASSDDQFKQLSNLVEIPLYRGWIVKFKIL
jgi:hypothetical protein